ncbi:MAG TPA: hypothetical protein VN137_09750, partial [Sphingomonas sp.]|nr:hypothetical protein [Sphingomonas sp.]
MQAGGAAFAGVQDAGSGLILEAEFAFEISQECPDDFGSIVTGRGIDVDVPTGPVGAASGGGGNKLAELARE